jgi:hypothetical protein
MSSCWKNFFYVCNNTQQSHISNFKQQINFVVRKNLILKLVFFIQYWDEKKPHAKKYARVVWGRLINK